MHSTDAADVPVPDLPYPINYSTKKIHRLQKVNRDIVRDQCLPYSILTQEFFEGVLITAWGRFVLSECYFSSIWDSPVCFVFFSHKYFINTKAYL